TDAEEAADANDCGNHAAILLEDQFVDAADPAAPKPPITPDVTKPAGDAAKAPAPAATADTAQTGYLTEKSPDQVSANTYIGQSVYN
ncbi:hypothetical protein AB9F39_36855, partial [Rhizobium leguminosarum]